VGHIGKVQSSRHRVSANEYADVIARYPYDKDNIDNKMACCIFLFPEEFPFKIMSNTVIFSGVRSELNFNPTQALKSQVPRKSREWDGRTFSTSLPNSIENGVFFIVLGDRQVEIRPLAEG
jgi:hypothetical protein